MSDFSTPRLFQNAHVSTIFPNLFRRVRGVEYDRQTVETPDGDFYDIDIAGIKSKKALILVHGLEGSSSSTYMLGMSKLANSIGYDAVALNHRGCSGTPNRKFTSYHSGFTKDVAHLIDQLQQYDEIIIVGFSLGGNVALKYAGTHAAEIDPRIKAVVAVSVTLDLAGSADELGKLHNSLYLMRFLRQLKSKALEKGRLFPEENLDSKIIRAARDFREFDDAYTAPYNGYGTAENYYRQASALNELDQIRIATLIINAKNDSFLTPGSFPQMIHDIPNMHLLTPELGGHVGFVLDNRLRGVFWHEQKVAKFVASL
ncbi:MAG: alpha/beta fold hydrolase [Bacteroidetes bacterium]|nr:alpha/beta fold hydrolase [Bacteroidota bacterium]